MFAGDNLAANNDNQFVDPNVSSWQSILATACNTGGYDMNDLLDFTQNDVGNNNQFVHPNVSQAGFVTPSSQIMTFMPDNQIDFQYFSHNTSHEDHWSRYQNPEPNPVTGVTT
ncbi:hypothetical protein Hanom_Chr15g01395611 [Helianthus anomalus]